MIVTPWWEAPEFAPMTGTLEALIASAQEYDFGLFILTPDDSIESRGVQGHTARDNVLFELGLFLGELGRDRCFALIQRGPGVVAVRVPSDLAGITIPRFDLNSPGDLAEAMTAACLPIRSVIERKGFRQLGFELVDGWSYDVDRRVFRMALSERLIADNFHRLQNRSLLLVVRRYNDMIDRDSDTSVVIGPPRRIPRGPQPLALEVPVESLLTLSGEPRVDGHLFLLPHDTVVGNLTSIDDILAIGGRLIESRGRRLPDTGG